VKTVSYTAQWTAAARAVESERGAGALFEDRFARPLAATRGFELLDRYQGAGLLPFIAIRTRFIDDGIRAVLAAGRIRQVVFIAVGMDTRAFRLSWPAGTVVYEVDHGALLEEKRARLAGLGAHSAVERREVPADLADDWVPELERAGFDRTAPTLWVAEGLLFFLTEAQAATLLATLKSVSAPESQLIVDMVNRQLLRSPFNQSFLRALRNDGTPWLFGTDEPAGLLAEAGWIVRELKEPGQTGVGDSRWPYQVHPRDQRRVPRSWLIRAGRM
jgi:methyltransferase (TIGR00027 family)